MSQMHSVVVSTPDGMRFYYSLSPREYDLYQEKTSKRMSPQVVIKQLKALEKYLPMSEEDQKWMFLNIEDIHWSWVSKDLREGVSKDEINKEIAIWDKSL